MKKIGVCLVFVFSITFCLAQSGKQDGSILIFEDSSKVKLSVFKDDSFDRLYYNEISYQIHRINQKYTLIKSEKNISNLMYGFEGNGTKFDLTFYPDFSKEKAFTYSKPVDRFEFYSDCDCLLAQINGCCAIPSICELSTIHENRTFLKYNQKFYKIQIIEPLINIYIGVETYPNIFDTNTLVFAKLYYSIDQNIPDTVLLKVKKISDFKEFYLDLLPTLYFYTESEHDEIEEWNYYHREYAMIIARSLHGIQGYSEINNIGVKLFVGYPDKKEFILKFVNGKIPQKEIIVEF